MRPGRIKASGPGKRSEGSVRLASSFPAGAETFLSGILPPEQIDLYSGFGVYDSGLEKSLRPFSRNVYTVLLESSRPLESFIPEIQRSASLRPLLSSLGFRRGSTFRIWPMIENQPASPRKYGIRGLEEILIQTCGLRFSGPSPDHCFYVIQRREGRSYFLVRTWVNEFYLPARGELSPEVAYLLCRLAEAGPPESVLDPFAGHGAIPRIAAEMLRCRSVTANDIDLSLLTRLPPGVHLSGLDFFRDPFPLTERPSRIITDPPWGSYRELAEKTDFYARLVRRCHSLLADDGILVLLSSNDPVIKEAVAATPGDLFACETVFPLLVHGKKALAWKLRKSRRSMP